MAPEPLSRENRVDWACVLSSLQAAGMNQGQIADRLSIGLSTLRGYLGKDSPSEPAHWTGHALLSLWCELCGRQFDDAPTKRVAPSLRHILRELNRESSAARPHMNQKIYPAGQPNF